MKRLRCRFPWMRRLRWKLTVSYALVTAAVLMISLLVVGGLLLTQSPQTPPVLAESLLDVAPQLAAYLHPLPDRAGLTQWLYGEAVIFNGTTGLETMAVADASGTVLATFWWADLPQGVSLDDQTPP